MKKIAFILLLTLTGCLGVNRHPYKDGRSKDKTWWTTPYTSSTLRDENPWLKFVPKKKVNEWYNPWKNDEDLRKYGVDILPGYKAKAQSSVY